MESFTALFFIIFICRVSASDHTDSLTWSRTFSYDAILEVPGANIVQPYKVWADGKTGNTRVDYYNGLDKFYRLRTPDKHFQFFKVHPQILDMRTGSQNVCHKLTPGGLVRIYSLNTYMPTSIMTYQGDELVSGTKCQKWVSIKNEKSFGFDISFVQTVWVVQEKVENNIFARPLRFDYKLTSGDVTLDEFNHLYLNYSFANINDEIFKLPDGMSCIDYTLSKGGPIDSLAEFVDPSIGLERTFAAFESFKLQHNKKYGDHYEHLQRLKIFTNNLRYIEAENKKHNTYTLAVNHLADLTEEEMLVFKGSFTDNNPQHYSDDQSDGMSIWIDNETIESAKKRKHFDWRNYNAITSVKEQTSLCGSCYAFATAAAVESSIYIQNGFRELREVSEQALVDCTWSVNNTGCLGGKFAASLHWVKTHGVPYKHEYGPYLAMEGLCHHSNMVNLGYISGHTFIRDNVVLMKKVLKKKGPLIAAIDSSPKSFMFYSGGVYNDIACSNSTESPNHGLIIIGYGSSNGLAHWTVKNSFGTTWGEDGYMRIAINKNICGVTNFVFSIDV